MARKQVESKILNSCLPKPLYKLLIIIQECQIEEITDEEDAPPKSSKDKKSNGPDKGPSLAFKLTNKVPYKTVLKGLGSI